MADLNKMLEGNVEDVKSQLADLNESELADLRKAEEDGKKRSTLLDAIDAETESRDGEEDERPTGVDGNPVKGIGDSTNRDSEQNIDDDRKARLETMGADTDDL